MKQWDENTVNNVGRWLQAHSDALCTLQKIQRPGTVLHDLTQRGNIYAVCNMVGRVKQQLQDAMNVIDCACDALSLDEVMMEINA